MSFGFRRQSRRGRLGAGGVVAAWLLAGCTSTVDSIGHDNAAPAAASATPPSLNPLTGPDTYDNTFHDLLNPPPSNDEIDSKVEGAYQQLFHGDPNTQAIYFTQGEDEAYIQDIYHDDQRTEGVGLGMLVSVELDHQDEFDRLWNYAKNEMRIRSGGGAGYFNSNCDNTNSDNTNTVMACVDPYGLEMFVTALIFAHDHWGTSKVGTIDYEADALHIFDVMLNKEKENGGIVGNFLDSFDAETLLVFDTPNVSAASRTRPSILMPAFYELWYQATGNAFFDSAATAARSFFLNVADQTTGLMPLRAYFDATPVPGSDTFSTEAYRAFPNLVLDEIWRGTTQWTVNFNRVLAFFLSQGFDKYGSAYELDGTVVSTDHEIALVLVNGITASKATSSGVSDSDRRRFVQAVWNQDTPTGEYRYYQGIMQLFALCVLSGKMQVL